MAENAHARTLSTAPDGTGKLRSPKLLAQKLPTIALGHAISARCDVDNGVANAIVLPHVVRLNADVAERGLRNLAASSGPLSPDGEPLGAVFILAFARARARRRCAQIGLTRRLCESACEALRARASGAV